VRRSARGQAQGRADLATIAAARTEALTGDGEATAAAPVEGFRGAFYVGAGVAAAGVSSRFAPDAWQRADSRQGVSVKDRGDLRAPRGSRLLPSLVVRPVARYMVGETL